jgi:hypothetical protein
MRGLRKISALSAVSAAAFALIPAASATSFGVADDGGKYANDGGSNFFLLLTDLGLTQNRISVTWDPTDGNQGFNIRERGFLDRVMPVAALRGIDIVLSVYPAHARVFAVDTPKRIELFAEYFQLLARTYPQVTTFIVGNEPNQPRFLQPQFLRTGQKGYRATAGALYEHVLARVYDLLKAVNPQITVVGLGLSPRGNDDPRARSNVSRSPVRFIHDLALEYRRSQRTRPLMDELGFHPYPRSNDDPLSHGYGWPNAGIPNLARIKQAIWDGFHDTAQPTFRETGFGLHASDDSMLHLELDEYGRQATVISSVARAYHGVENVRTITEGRQANMYAAVVRRIACDPAVSGFFFFHLIDEADLDRFQSGLVRVDGTKRPSYDAVKATLAATKGKCVGPYVTWHHTTTVLGADVTFDGPTITVEAGEDVSVTAGVFPSTTESDKILDELLANRVPASASQRVVHAYRPSTFPVSLESLAPGPYVAAVVLRAVMNPERDFLAVSDPILAG